jgi:hypothetical protein
VLGKEYYPLGKEPIQPINKVIDKYSDWVSDVGGFDESDAKTKYMGAMLAVGELLLDADLGAGNKGKALFKETIERIEKETGKKVAAETTNLIAEKISYISKIEDKVKRQKALEETVADFIVKEKPASSATRSDFFLNKQVGDKTTEESMKQAKASGKSFDEWAKGQGEIIYRGQPKDFKSCNWWSIWIFYNN